MPETKADLEARVAQLETENQHLRTQLAGAAAQAPTAYAPRRPFLSEGERQELEMYGVTNSPFTGERLTTENVRAELEASEDQHRVELADADPAVARAAGVPTEPRRTPGILGVDYIPPSIAPGVIDPQYAGKPGVSGPTAPPADE